MLLEQRYIFPAVLLLCNLGAAAVALRERDWFQAVYFTASGVCIAAVAFRN